MPDSHTLSRRDFLLFSAAAALLTATGCARRGEPAVGLALGGGGAKGLAHILMLEALDDMGIVPRVIAGSSIGAIIGALYASGLKGREIRAQIEQFFVGQDDVEHKLFALPKSIRWLDFIDPAFVMGGLLDSSDFISYIGELMPARRFRDLKIPLKVVTAELMTGEQVVIDSGKLLPAVQASMAVPGVFPPVEIDGRTLVDGGVANPLPYDLVEPDSDIVIAIDVSGSRDFEADEKFSSLGVLLQSFNVMSHNILTEKLRHQRPTVYVKPDIRNVQILEFYKARQVFEQAQPAQRQFVKSLEKAMRKHNGRPGCSMTAGVM
jgi:NTE family protein